MKIYRIMVIFVLMILPITIFSENKIEFSKKRGKIYITIDVVNYPVKKLLKQIAKEKKMELIFSANVRGEFTGRFTKVPVDMIFDKILKCNNLSYEKLGNIYRVDSIKSLDAYRQKMLQIQATNQAVKDLETHMIKINYVSLSSISNNVQKLLSDRGSVMSDERTKKLIVTDVPEKFPIVYKFIQAIDVPTRQVLIKVKFVQINHSNLEHIEFYWSADNKNTSSATKITGGSYTGSSSAYPSSNAGLLRIGIVKNYVELEGVLNMLASNNKAIVRSHPQILALNNEAASINIGNKIPLRMVDETGKLTTQLTSVGTQIQVTPQITANNQIILKIHPEVSSIAGQFGSGVLIDTNQIDTQIMLKNKETAVIGGLVKSEDTRTKAGIPFLSDIPIIGALFRSKETSKNRIEILIMVTPIIQEGNNE